MSAILVQLCLETVSPSDACVARIAELMGLRVVVVNDVRQAKAELEAATRNGEAPIVLALSGATALHRSFADESLHPGLMQELREKCSLFVYGFADKSARELLAQLLQRPQVPPLESVPAGSMTWQFSPALRGPLAGHSFVSMSAAESMVFPKLDSPNGDEVLLSANGHPFLISYGRAGGRDYFLSQSPAISVDAPVTPSRSVKDYYPEVLPVALALRQMFGFYCWHNPFPTACIVIDDPLLQSRYGFFDYSAVLAELTEKKYTLTVAFIPSNYQRSDRQVAAQVARHADALTLCVHGCDHTGGEFGETDARSIESKAALGMANMEEHQRLTGLGFDSVMVFPQGIFSSCSLGALKRCGYLAAVNTVPYPTDYLTAPVALADVFDLAVTRFDSFPMFTRQYPRAVFDFAVDLFWGKPTFIVEHHEYYRNGPGPASAFVNQLRQLEPQLEWLTLEKAVLRSGHYRLVAPGSYVVKFVTATFEVRNPSPHRAHFDCRKPESEPDRILGVLVNQQAVAYRMEANFLCLGLDLNSQEQGIITVQYKPYQPIRINRSIKYRVTASVRRRLCQFRDNYLARNDRAFNLAKSLKRWVRR